MIVRQKVTVTDFMGDVQKEFDVEKGTKLLKALIDNGIEIVHACGGQAKCTCRVNIEVDTPKKGTKAQKELFEKKVKQGLPQFMAPRMFLSCQLLVEVDMEVCPMELYNFTVHDDFGKDTEEKITPDPVWLDKEES